MIRFLLMLVCATVPAFGFVNNGVMLNQVVNDPVFINNGLFEVQAGTTDRGSLLGYSQTPWESFSTDDFQNNGTITGISMRFMHTDPVSLARRPAASFINSGGSVIDAANLLESFSLAGFGNISLNPGSLLRIQADTMVNEGLLRAGPSGLIMLRGERADLSFGTMAIDPMGYFRGALDFCDAFPFFIDTDGNIVSYLNPAGVYDIYWGTGTQTNLNVRTFMTDVPTMQVRTPPHDVSTGGPLFATAFALTNAASWGLVSQVDATNYVVQAIFVQTSDTNMVAEAQWIDFAYPNGLRQVDKFYTAQVTLNAPLFDPISLQILTNRIVILDQLASATNQGILPEAAGAGSIGGAVLGSRPGTFWVSRCEPFSFFGGVQSNAVVSPALFWDPSFATPVVSNIYAGHSFQVDSLPSRPPTMQGVTVADFPGRIEIEADEVNMFRSGIRGEGLVSIVTDHLESSIGAVIDSQNLNFDLARRVESGPLRIENLSKDTVERLAGTIRMWSAVFTNQFTNVVGTVTNINTIGYHVLVVNASQMSSKQEVTVADFRVRAPTVELTIMDNMIVSNRFEIQSQDVTIAGRLELRGSVWASTNVPNLRNFTNETTGRLQLIGLTDFGGPAQSLTSFVNRGTINSYSFNIDAQNVENSGLIFSGERFNGFFFFFDPNLLFTDLFFTNSGPINVNARTAAILDGGQFVTYGDINLTGEVYKFSNYSMYSGGSINLRMARSLQDSGAAAANTFVVSNAFNLLTPVAYGNLLGTTVSAQPARARAFRSSWAMADLGGTTAAFTTQAAIGRLVLNTDTNSLFQFTGTSANRAIYVDVLEIVGPGITNLATLNFNFALVNGIDFYYADVFAPALEDDAARESKTVAEWLNGRVMQGGGVFRWVPTFISDSNSVDVARFGSTQSTRMNRSLRESLIIDTDGDGIPNGLDEFPLDNQLPPIVVTAASGTPRASVTFTAEPLKTYVVESAPLVTSAVWNLVGTYRNTQAQALSVTITDTVAATDATRFYRVREQ